MERVTIYEDPISLLKPEEEVELLELRQTQTGLERWLVRYDDGFEAERWINKSQLEAS